VLDSGLLRNDGRRRMRKARRERIAGGTNVPYNRGVTGKKVSRRWTKRQAANASIVLLGSGVALLFLSWVFGSTVLWLVAAGCFGAGFWVLFGKVLAKTHRRRKR
jgi:hypothetical protein